METESFQKEDLTKKRGALFWAIAGLIFSLVVILIGSRMRNRFMPEPVMIMTPEPTPLPTPTAPPPPLRVYVNGAVNRGDVYELPAGSRINDAILAAGGFTEEADTRLLNLAQPVVDGMHIYIPTQEEVQGTEPPVVEIPADTPAADAGGNAGNAQSGLLVNINTAGLEALEELPGIGPALAQRIIDYRDKNGPFTTIEAVQEVSGIGPATFDDIKDLITVE